jgi:hypothetical protein
MRSTLPLSLIIIGSIGLISYTLTPPEEEKKSAQENFYQKSLHYTNKGLSFVYSKEHGGLERLTGLSAEEMECLKAKCHATACDACHGKDSAGMKFYSSDTATLYNACKKCHGDLAKDNPDIHFAKGMKCMDCHTSREIHGDGKEHNSYLEPGFFDVSCKKCHITVTPSESHKTHGDKLDCTACHSNETTTCLNCHIGNRLNGIKEAQIPLEGMAFLVNHGGKVTRANMLSYVYKDKTMITFAKSFGHSVKREGARCRECHGSGIVKEMKAGSFRLVTWEQDTLRNRKGIVPVLEGYDWNLVYLNREKDKWIPILNPPEPLLNYSGYCSPITPLQLEKLLKSH